MCRMVAYICPICRITYVNMQENYVSMQDNYVFVQGYYVDVL